MPTATPAPEPTPDVCPTAAESRFLLALGEGLVVFDEALVALERLSARVEADPSALMSGEVRSAFRAHAQASQAAAQRILDVRLPSPVRQPALVGVSWTMASSMRDGMEGLLLSFQDLDAGRIDQALFQLEQAMFAVDNAIFFMEGLDEDIERFCG